jgi:hypothetical protein
MQGQRGRYGNQDGEGSDDGSAQHALLLVLLVVGVIPKKFRHCGTKRETLQGVAPPACVTAHEAPRAWRHDPGKESYTLL